MPTWLLYASASVAGAIASILLFFFAVTRGALLVRAALGGPRSDVAHVYPVYSSMRLIRLVDFQPVISAILLFQYDRLVSAITSELRRLDLRGKDVMITSCAFGSVIPRVVSTAMEAGARQVLILDIIKNELDHAREKLPEFEGHLVFLEENCTAMKAEDGSVGANVIFFLLHELPHHLKGEALREAVRVLSPGGKLVLAEFHRPDTWLLRALSWTYFKAFEPLGLALWNTHEPLKQLEDIGGITSTRRTVFFGNFQIIVAAKNSTVIAQTPD
jgi:ubiquinone/menaquinone biosynthesis C-methylase UbiE